MEAPRYRTSKCINEPAERLILRRHGIPNSQSLFYQSYAARRPDAQKHYSFESVLKDAACKPRGNPAFGCCTTRLVDRPTSPSPDCHT
jgi:hypothetical protein